MHQHPELATALIAEHERDLARRVQRRRTVPARERPIRASRIHGSAAWRALSALMPRALSRSDAPTG
jgi:hypothetical protein